MTESQENQPNYISRYLRQQAELFPGDFYIHAGSEVAGQVEDPAEIHNPEVPPYAPRGAGDLAAYNDQICLCKRCPLGETRNRFVFGVGNPDADLLFIGEAPGYQEDKQGEPFVGRAGKLLDKILAAIHLNRNDVYIANVLKCRPPDNRDPHTDEIDACEPYLQNQIELIAPRVIIALGRVAGNTLLKSSSSLKDLRGRTWNYHGTDLVVTYHPAALLRNKRLKYPTWEDFQMIQERYLS